MVAIMYGTCVCLLSADFPYSVKLLFFSVEVDIMCNNKLPITTQAFEVEAQGSYVVAVGDILGDFGSREV